MTTERTTTAQPSADPQRSWWGWGSSAQALTVEESDTLVGRMSTLLPEHDFTDHRPPDPQTLDVPTSRLKAPGALARLCSEDRVDRLAHARGKAFRDVVRNLHGDVGPVPDLVARPQHEDDIVDLLDWCSRESVPVIPYGGGSSVVGGVEPRVDGPALTLDLTALDRVL